MNTEMDFQKILELASKNQKAAEKQVTKRYSSKVPPPKKEPRPLVDPDAIRARIDAKEKERRQKVIDEERARKEGALRQQEAERKLAEEKRNNRRAARKPKTTPEQKTRKESCEPADKLPESSYQSTQKSSQHSSQKSSNQSLQKPFKKSSPKSSHPSSQKSLIKSARQSSEDSFSRRAETSKYQDKQHEAVHKSFMYKVERDAEINRERMIRKEERTSKPKLNKKSAPIPKKPMSYEEVLKFAKHRNTGNIGKRDPKAEDEEDIDDEDEESEEEEYDTRPKEWDDRHYNRDREHSRESKIKDRLKLERMGKIPHLNGRKNEPNKQGVPNSQKLNNNQTRIKKDSNEHRHVNQTDRSAMNKNSGKIHTDDKKKEVKADGFKKLVTDKGGNDRKKINGIVKMQQDRKPTHGSAERPAAKAGMKVNGGDKAVPRPSEKQPIKTSDKTKLSEKQPVRSSEKTPVKAADRQSRPAERVPSRPGDKANSKLSGRPDARPVPSKPSRPSEHPEGRSRDHPRPVGHDRDRPRPSGMGPPRGPPLRGPDASRKRPAKPPIMHVKRGRVMVSDSEESDYDDGDGFIDDTLIDDSRGADVSSYIREIFGYDKSKYGYESDYALRAMDTSYKDIQREEARSARLGMLEDLEDMRKEKEDMKRKAMKKAKKR